MECVSLGPGWEEMDIGFLSTQDIRSLLSPICVFTLLLLHFSRSHCECGVISQ